MAKSIDVYLKVEADLGEGETEGQITNEIVRMLERLYGVRKAEVTNIITHSDS